MRENRRIRGILPATLVHLLPSQVAGRALRRMRRLAARPARVPRLAVNPELTTKTSFPALQDKSAPSRTFEFLGWTTDLEPPVDWDPNDAPALVRYKLNYFDFLATLDDDTRRDMCMDWIFSNRPFRSTGWDPYPTSLRIINWVKHTADSHEVRRSLYTQADYLARFPEVHLLGNHFLENARALIFAGSAFPREQAAEQWLRKGISIYGRQTHEQILPDGGHFERSPMYHAIVLEGYLDVLNLLGEGHPAWRRLKSTASDMLTFLVALTHPDGTIALFNDATTEVAPSTHTLCAYAFDVAGLKPEHRSAFRDTGYFVHRDSQVYAVIDAGPIGPDYLPAHAHADIFSFELSRRGRGLIVDSGVYEYQRGAMRDYVRSTRAHNTVEIDGRDQVEVWGEFRVGRRSRPYGVRFDDRTDGFDFSGTFSGYRKIIGDGIRHVRRMSLKEGRLSIQDDVSGSGQHKVVSRLHLHPDVTVSRQGDSALELAIGSERCLLTSTGGELGVAQGWYCPEFGKKLPNAVVELAHNGNLPVQLQLIVDLGLN